MAMRLDTKHSMLRRCRGWDYCQPCIYMVTLVLADRGSQVLGRLVIAPGLQCQAQENLVLSRQAQNAGQSGQSRDVSCLVLEAAASSYIALSPAGEAVLAEFKCICEHHPEVMPLFMQVMPDHVHFIIHVTRPMAKPLGNVIGGFKAGSSKAAIGCPGLWAAGFQDTILFHEGQLDAMFSYLRDNPRRLAVKRLLPGLFRVTRDLCLQLPLQARDTFPAHFSAIGNHFLLESPTILQVQCSRADFAYERRAKPGGGLKIERNADGEPMTARITPQFEAKRDELLAAARHGAVLASPCISDGEREIARIAFASGAAVISLRNMGFSPLYKPGGRSFDKAANGKLLMLAPIAWPYSTAEKAMTRFDACVLNRIAQLISGPGAAEINYKGMKPNDIDRLVRAAVFV